MENMDVIKDTGNIENMGTQRTENVEDIRTRTT